MIYVMSDLHGKYKLFLEMLELIQFSDKDTLYIIGDVVDRGEEPIRILQYIMKCENIHLILGNHEQMLLDSYRQNFNYYAYDTQLWVSNGGFTTYDELMTLKEEERLEIISYLSTLPYKKEITIDKNKFILVHGCYGNNKKDILWKRMNESVKRPTDAIIVFGHTPTCNYQIDTPYIMWKQDNLIDIDCGLARQRPRFSQLGCLRLDDLKEFYITLEKE